MKWLSLFWEMLYLYLAKPKFPLSMSMRLGKVKPMEHDPDFLRELCEKIVTDPDLKPNNGLTWCNKAVDRVAVAYAGYNGFEGMLANDMVEKMRRSMYWQKLQPDEAGVTAMAGGLVIAGMKDEPHGHVAIVMSDPPSKNGHPLMTYSGNFKCEVPRIANVGSKNGIMSANWAFRKLPDFYAYTPKKK